MHFLSEFTVLTLQHLQPFLLGLGPCDLVSSAVFDVLSPVRVRRQGKRLILQDDWILSLEAKYLFIVKGDVLVPHSCNLSILSYSIFFVWLFPLSANELFHKLRFHLPDSPLEVV